MLEINGYDVAITRGDSLILRVNLNGRDLPEGTDAVVTLKKSIHSEETILQKRFDASGETLNIHLTPTETDLTPGVYVWDLRLQIPLEDGSHEVLTPMEYAAFAVLPVVGTELT